MSQRLPECEARYQDYKENNQLHDLTTLQVVRDFDDFFIAKNDFCHCKIASVSDLLILKRKTTFNGIEYEEWEDLLDILTKLNEEGYYDNTVINFTPVRSVNDIFHIHLYVLKPEYK